jgi:hypothetical protein
MRCQMENYMGSRFEGRPQRCHRRSAPTEDKHMLCYQHRDKYFRHPDIYRPAIHDESFWAAHGQPDVSLR